MTPPKFHHSELTTLDTVSGHAQYKTSTHTHTHTFAHINWKILTFSHTLTHSYGNLNKGIQSHNTHNPSQYSPVSQVHTQYSPVTPKHWDKKLWQFQICWKGFMIQRVADTFCFVVALFEKCSISESGLVLTLLHHASPANNKLWIDRPIDIVHYSINSLDRVVKVVFQRAVWTKHPYLDFLTPHCSSFMSPHLPSPLSSLDRDKLPNLLYSDSPNLPSSPALIPL